MYAGNTPSSDFSAALAFFSLFLLDGGAAAAVTTLAFFWSNLACFSAFFRSRSTTIGQQLNSYIDIVVLLSSQHLKRHPYVLSRSSPSSRYLLPQRCPPCYQHPSPKRVG